MTQTNLFFVETELGEEVVLLDDAVHALQQREERVLGVEQHLALPLVLALLRSELADARQSQELHLEIKPGY